MPILLYGVLSFIVFCVVALLLTPNLFRPSPEAVRFLELSKSSRQDRRTIRGKEMLQERLMGIGTGLRIRLGMAENPKLKARMASAGIAPGPAVDLFFASQFLIPLAFAGMGSLVRSNTAFWVFALGVVGYLAPDMWLNWKIGKRRNRIRRSIPDALDLMVICVDAGLGLDQALHRISGELSISHPDISYEFTQVNLEQRAGSPRLDAWKNLAERTKIEEFIAFVNMVSQTDKFGTPIIRALSRFAEDIRLKRRQHAEQMAAKTKIKIIFPLVLCIFPCIFIVLLAPALMNIMDGLKNMGH